MPEGHMRLNNVLFSPLIIDKRAVGLIGLANKEGGFTQRDRFAILGAVITGFSRVVAVIGAVMIVSGNIAGTTRVMTTAIIHETRKGNFELAIGLGLILLLIFCSLIT